MIVMPPNPALMFAATQNRGGATMEYVSVPVQRFRDFIHPTIAHQLERKQRVMEQEFERFRRYRWYGFLWLKKGEPLESIEETFARVESELNGGGISLSKAIDYAGALSRVDKVDMLITRLERLYEYVKDVHPDSLYPVPQDLMNAIHDHLPF